MKYRSRKSLDYLDGHISKLDSVTFQWVVDNLWNNVWELLDKDPRV